MGSHMYWMYTPMARCLLCNTFFYRTLPAVSSCMMEPQNERTRTPSLSTLPGYKHV